MANFCGNCGSPLGSDNRFCPNCGAPVTVDDAAGPVASAPSERPFAKQPAPGSLRSAPPPDSASSMGPAVGAAATATAGAFRQEPAPEKPQGDFVPPQRQPYSSQQNMYPEAGPGNEAFTPAPGSEYRPDFPPQNYNRPSEFARGGTGPKYEPDTDLKSMFLRYDNRLNRKRYIFRGFALGAAVSIITKLLTIIAVSMHSSAIVTLGTIISIAAAIPSFMLIIRRLHDLNRPAWWCIGVFIPLVNIVLGIYLLFLKGTDGPNDYGPDPLEVPSSTL